MKGQVRIEEMFAFIVMDDDNTEGVPAISTRIGAMPLMGADLARVDSLRPHAQLIAKEMGKKITLVKFTNRVELEVIE